MNKLTNSFPETDGGLRGGELLKSEDLGSGSNSAAFWFKLLQFLSCVAAGG